MGTPQIFPENKTKQNRAIFLAPCNTLSTHRCLRWGSAWFYSFLVLPLVSAVRPRLLTSEKTLLNFASLASELRFLEFQLKKGTQYLVKVDLL